MKNIIFIAPPAAGKGTQSNLLVSKYGYEHISTGDLLRKEISLKTELGSRVQNIIDKGNLVPDDLIIELTKNKLSEISGKPFILDGFPRTLNQAQILKEVIKDLSYTVVYLDLDKEIAVKRMLGRLTCSCGKSYNIYDEKLKPQKEDICDNCGKKLIKRNDDTEEFFTTRFETFINNTAAILEFYQKENVLNTINADMHYLDIFKEIEKVIE